MDESPAHTSTWSFWVRDEFPHPTHGTAAIHPMACGARHSVVRRTEREDFTMDLQESDRSGRATREDRQIRKRRFDQVIQQPIETGLVWHCKNTFSVQATAFDRLSRTFTRSDVWFASFLILSSASEASYLTLMEACAVQAFADLDDGSPSKQQLQPDLDL